MQKLSSADPGEQLAGATWFRQLLSKEDNPPIDEVVEAGLVPRLVELLSSHGSDPQLQLEAARALAGIASDSPGHRDTVLEAEPVAGLAGLLADTSELQLRQGGAAAAYQLCRGKPAPALDDVARLVPVLASVLCSGESDEAVLVDVCWTLVKIANCNENAMEVLLTAEPPLLPRLVQMLDSSIADVQKASLYTVADCIKGTEKQTQAALDAGAVPALGRLLSSPKSSIRKEACFALSNVAAGTAAQAGQLQSTGVIRPVVERLGRQQRIAGGEEGGCLGAGSPRRESACTRGS